MKKYISIMSIFVSLVLLAIAFLTFWSNDYAKASFYMSFSVLCWLQGND